MSRPKPDIILEHVDKKTYKSLQVLRSKAIYAVFYENAPINLKNKHSMLDYPSPKYKKVSFANPGHAFNLADKLNKQFNTKKFNVVEMLEGKSVTRDEFYSE